MGFAGAVTLIGFDPDGSDGTVIGPDGSERPDIGGPDGPDRADGELIHLDDVGGADDVDGSDGTVIGFPSTTTEGCFSLPIQSLGEVDLGFDWQPFMWPCRTSSCIVDCADDVDGARADDKASLAFLRGGWAHGGVDDVDGADGVDGADDVDAADDVDGADGVDGADDADGFSPLIIRSLGEVDACFPAACRSLARRLLLTNKLCDVREPGMDWPENGQ